MKHPRQRHGLRIGIALFISALITAVSFSTDFDQDRLPDDWEALHGFSTNGLPSTNVVYSQLVGWWQMDDTSQTNVLDRSTNNLVGTLINFPAFPFVEGVFSNALAFTTNSYVSFATPNGVLDLGNSFTISLWFLGTNATEETTLIEWNDVNTNTWELSVDTNGAAQFRFGDSEANVQIVKRDPGATDIRENHWHHLAGSYDAMSSNAILYVDGSVEASLVLTNWGPTTVNTFGFGIISIPPPNAPFSLDEVRLYSVALSSNDIAQLPNTYADPDGDGLNNLQEYEGGTDPLDYYNGVLPTLRDLGGNNQVGLTNAFLPLPLLVITVNTNEVPLTNAPLTFAVSQGSGQISLSTNGSPLATSLTLRTGTNGQSQVFFYGGATEGTNLVTVTAVSGTNSTQVTFTEVIKVDLEPPTITCSSNLVATTDAGQCSRSNLTFTVTATDNSGTNTITCVPSSGSTFSLGTNTVNCTATDFSSNSNSCSFQVTVQDIEPPAITCPSNLTVQCDADVPAPNTNAVVASDNCGSVTLTHLGDAVVSSSQELIINGDFETGSITGWTRTGGGGPSFPGFNSAWLVTNSSYLPFIPPMFAPSTAPCGGVYYALSVLDFPGTITLYQQITIPTNATSAVLRWTDKIHNSAALFGVPGSAGWDSTINYSVSLRSTTDTLLLPIFSTNPGDPFSTPCTNRTADISQFSGQTVRVTFVSQSVWAWLYVQVDNVSVLASSSGGPGSKSITRTYQAVDSHNNTNTCTQMIVVHDTIPPVFNCPTNQTLTCTTNGTAVGTYTVPTATDNCDTNSSVGCSPASGTAFPLGTNTVTCTSTDTTGNSTN